MPWIVVTDEEGQQKGICPTSDTLVCIGAGEIKGVVLSPDGEKHYTEGIPYDPFRRENADSHVIIP